MRFARADAVGRQHLATFIIRARAQSAKLQCFFPIAVQATNRHRVDEGV